MLPFGNAILVCLPIWPFALQQKRKIRPLNRLIFSVMTRGDNVPDHPALWS